MRIRIHHYENDPEAERYLEPMRAQLTAQGHPVTDSVGYESPERPAPSDVADADAFILLISDHALRLDRLTRDARQIMAYAEGRGRPEIIPHLIGRVHFEDVPPPLNRRRLLRAQKPDYIFPQLAETLERIARVQVAETQERPRPADDEGLEAPGARARDLFLSYAREDESVATELYEALGRSGFNVFFDRVSLTLGDSLTEKIDREIARCRHGVVLLSPSYLAAHKRWTKKELKSLLARQTRTGRKCVLPVWHGVTERDVSEFSEELADFLAVKTEDGLDKVADEIAKAVSAAAETNSIIPSHRAGQGIATPAASGRQSLRSLALEVELNERLIATALDLAQRWPRRGESENFSYEEYHCVRASEALTSGELDPHDDADRRLSACMQQYQQAIAGFNAGLRIVGRHNPGMFLKRELIHVTATTQWPEDVEHVLSDSFSQLVKAHRCLQEGLRGFKDR